MCEVCCRPVALPGLSTGDLKVASMQAARSPEAEFGTPTTARLPQSIGQSKSHGQVRMQKENTPVLDEKNPEVTSQKETGGVGPSLQTVPHTRGARRLPGGRMIVTGFRRLSELFQAA